MEVLNSNLMDNENENLLNVKYFEKRYGAEGDTEAEAGGEKEYENEDNTEYESEESEIGDTSDTDLPKFRTLVRNKKLELKAQYGKAKIENRSVMERECKNVQIPKIRMVDKEVCVNVPYTHWDSNINCKEVCVKWNIKLQCQERENKCLGGFIGGTRQECKTVKVPEGYTELEEICINVPKIRFVWVSGWRKQWREFKRNGGLAQLKLQSKGLYTPPQDIYIPQPSYVPQPTYTPPPEPEFDEYQDWSCQELSDEFGIINAVTWGKANDSVQKSWTKRGCTTSPTVEKDDGTQYDDVPCQDLSNDYGIIAGQGWGTADEGIRNSWIRRGCNTKPIVEAEETEEESSEDDGQESKPKSRPKAKSKTSAKTSSLDTEDKILGMPKDVAIGIGVALALVGGFMLIRKKG